MDVGRKHGITPYGHLGDRTLRCRGGVCALYMTSIDLFLADYEILMLHYLLENNV